jgi:membrane-bound serine protease (ClpP class)
MSRKGWFRQLVLALLFLGIGDLHASSNIVVLDITGAIGPASADHFTRGLDHADSSSADLVVLRLDTPGGLDKSMRHIIKALLSSPIPVATYVTPQGARAASAGTYILYASHIAAMTPATNLGAATPVQIGTPSLPTMPSPDESDPQEKSTPNPPDKKNTVNKNASAMEKKIINDAVAYITGLAKLRDRNIDWAVRAVRHGESLTASTALEMGVIDYIAADLHELLEQLNGKEISINKTQKVLETTDANISYFQPDWRNRFLSVITDPNVAYILMLLGIYGIILEFSNPGMALPGIVGAVCLMLALYAFQVLPVSYAGLGLIILGVLLMVGEAFAPSFGVLGLGGLIAFIIGSIILMDTTLPAYQIALPVIIALALLSAAFFIVVLGMALRVRKQSVVTGLSSLEGKQATVESMSGRQARVLLEGEWWQVDSDQSLNTGDEVKVVSAKGVTLGVKKIKENNHGR